MLEVLDALVSSESPTANVDLCRTCAGVLAERGSQILHLDAEILEIGGRPHVRWRGASPRVLVIGHFDTVWPAGTIDRWPFSVSDGIATGPGVFDMKAGLVQGLYALAGRGSLDDVDIVFTSDEEIGSPTAQPLYEEAARAVDAAFVLEPSANGALKVARKGVATYLVEVKGLASHAGLNPHDGVNALSELARQVIDIEGFADGATTVTPTIAKAGTATNTVPASAILRVDVRVPTFEEQDRIDAAMSSLRTHIDGASVDVTRTSLHPPMPRSTAEALFARAQNVASTLGMAPLDGVEVGGGSDGNFTAAVGTPTLDGLGAVGDGAHAEGEHVIIDRMSERAALFAALVDDVIEGGIA